MKKVFLFAALTGLFLASCSNDEFFGATENTSTTNEIGFGMDVPNLTRATTGGAAAAQKLNNNFVVYGFKCEGDEQADDSGQQTVFGRYNVNYIGNSGTTQSNTKGWEYVGYNDLQGDLQTMKYWDYSAKSYVFSAIAGVGVTPEKTTTGTTVYDKGWKVTIPAGGSLSALYASSRVPVVKEAKGDVYKYPETVNMTFYSMATKVRFGVYETVSGYSVSIDKFYCMGTDGKFSSESNTTTNFGINGKFLTPNAKADTKLTVTYYDAASGIENRPKVNFTPDPDELKKLHSAQFGTNMQAQTKIGETSVTATYDKANGEYTFILPYKIADNNLQLYVDFTLTAANGETIKVKQAKATVPAAYTQWKENFAYTYLFKISDNTNGTTGTPSDPDDPTVTPPAGPNDPQGLYSITFDACIVNAEEGLTEEGVQEVIASTTTPSITTYAKGTVVTANNEYTAGKVYYSAMDNAKTPAFIGTDKSAVYEVVYTWDKAPLTEALIADYSKGNGVMLVPVATTAETAVPLSDGTNLTFAADQCMSFVAKEGKNYVIVYTVDGKETFKLVRVAGTDSTTPSYKVGVTSGATITTTTGNIVCKIADNNSTASDKGIKGAIPFITITKGGTDVTADFNISAASAGIGRYVITLTQEAINAGANGTYTVNFKDVPAANTFEVNLEYKIVYDPLDASVTTATVVKNGSTHTVTLNVASDARKGAKINIPSTLKGITITDNGNGKYTIAADETAALGAPADITIAGQPVSVTVISFSFDPTSKTIDWPEGKLNSELKTTIQLMKDGAIYSAKVPVGSSNPAVFVGTDTDTDGKLELIPVAGGKTKLTYENAECDYTVNKWELKGAAENPDETKITRATGSTKLTLWLNDKQQNAATKTVTVKKLTKTSPETWQVKTDGFSLTSDGRDLTFGNVAVDGTYKIEYYNEDGDVVLGYEVITVN